MSLFGMSAFTGEKRVAERVGCNGPMRGIPRRAAVFDNDRLRRFMPDPQTRCHRIRQFPVFDNENQSTIEIFGRLCEMLELLVDGAADRALRAMLENEYGIGLRSL